MPKSKMADNTFLIPYLIAEATVQETLNETAELKKDLERARSIAVALESELAEKTAQINRMREIANHALSRQGTHTGCIEATDVFVVFDSPSEEEKQDISY